MILDKYTPSHHLEEFQNSNYRITNTALKSAFELGFNSQEIKSAIKSMKKEHFYKSMTSKYNHKLWQDVYHVPFKDYLLYIKFTKDMISEFTLLSFKEK